MAFNEPARVPIFQYWTNDVFNIVVEDLDESRCTMICQLVVVVK